MCNVFCSNPSVLQAKHWHYISKFRPNMFVDCIEEISLTVSPAGSISDGSKAEDSCNTSAVGLTLSTRVA